ncbi:hypothetical protein JCM8208_005247 [Rhodotorula glutinis]
MQAHSSSVPWQEQRDPFLAQLSLLVSWFVRILAQSRLRTNDWRSHRKTALLRIVEQFSLHHETWLGDELRGALEYLLETYVGLLAPHAVEFFDWYQLTYKEIGRKVGRFPLEGHPSLSSGANAQEANAFAQVRTAARRAGTAFYGSGERGVEFEHEFCGEAGVTILKMRRMDEVARDKLMDEVMALPDRVPERVEFLEKHGLPTTAADVLPSPTATMLWAHDASQPPSARLARFHSLVTTLLHLYTHALSLSLVPPAALPPLERCAHELAHLPGPVEDAFARKVLAANDLTAAFHGVPPSTTVAAAVSGAPHGPLVDHSLGAGGSSRRARRARASRFFPEARGGAW